ncbi:MAG: tRNA epoxyqueuosine(34) reductase QueG, partial [Gammaproteobacteria bacterium]|nr:tRNA epoxyqueuosine(34) reductase QueG [Gammaproteobacteria bacterium]
MTNNLTAKIKQWAKELEFTEVGITTPETETAKQKLAKWLAKGYHGTMTYMTKQPYGSETSSEFTPKSVISCAVNYLPDCNSNTNISRYALGRDYHKVVRNRLHKLAKKIEIEIGPHKYRCFNDSSQIQEKALAINAGIGWQGKNSLIINPNHGSWLFLGEIFTDLELACDQPQEPHCGNCNACIKACPTKAIVKPYQIDARRCIAYLTIEHKGSIPLELRPLMGKQIYGCDFCQAACPWNRFAKTSPLTDFQPRNNLDTATLIELFGWSEEEFLIKTEGSSIRRIGHERWLRNIAVALGNSPQNGQTIAALKSRLQHSSDLVREHVAWALDRLTSL